MTELVKLLQDFAAALFSTTEGSTGILIQFFNWVTSATVLPYFGLGICVSLILLAVKIVRGTVWGV